MSELLILLHPSHTAEQRVDLVRLLHREQSFRVITEFNDAMPQPAVLFWVIDEVWSEEEVFKILPSIRRTGWFPVIIEFRREVSADLTVALIALDAFIRDRFVSRSSMAGPSHRASNIAASFDASAQKPRSLRVLLADDHDSNRLLIARIIQDMGHQAIVVEDGEQAVAAVKQGGIDLVLMDCQMPVLDGIEAARQIRGLNGPNSQIPILAVTANHSPGLRQLCHSVGMNGFVSKPVDTELLKRCMKELTRQRHTESLASQDNVQPLEADIDASHLNQVRELDGTGQFLFEMIDAFLVKLDAMVSDLEQKIQKADLPAIERAAHYLKSSAGNVGARAIWRVLNQIEEFARAGNVASLNAEWKKLNPLVRLTREEFTNLWMTTKNDAA